MKIPTSKRHFVSKEKSGLKATESIKSFAIIAIFLVMLQYCVELKNAKIAK